MKNCENVVKKEMLDLKSLVAVDEGIFQFLSYIFEIWTKFKTNEKDILLWLVCTGDQIKVQNQP